MEFTASQITKITGVKRTRLQQWLERGYLAPSVQQASGSGTRNIYSLIDLYSIALFKKITEFGLSRTLVADMLQKTLLGDVADDSDVARIKHIVYMRTGDMVEATASELRKIDLNLLTTLSTKEEYDNMYIINFEKIRKQIDDKIYAVIG